MAFFALIPLYWLTSMLLFAASPRQKINVKKEQALISPIVAWTSFFVINIASFIWLITNGWSALVVTIDLLLLNMLMLPATIIFITHKPQWFKSATIAVFTLSAFIQLIAQGYWHVA